MARRRRTVDSSCVLKRQQRNVVATGGAVLGGHTQRCTVTSLHPGAPCCTYLFFFFCALIPPRPPTSASKTWKTLRLSTASSPLAFFPPQLLLIFRPSCSRSVRGVGNPLGFNLPKLTTGGGLRGSKEEKKKKKSAAAARCCITGPLEPAGFSQTSRSMGEDAAGREEALVPADQISPNRFRQLRLRLVESFPSHDSDADPRVGT